MRYIRAVPSLIKWQGAVRRLLTRLQGATSKRPREKECRQRRVPLEVDAAALAAGDDLLHEPEVR